MLPARAFPAPTRVHRRLLPLAAAIAIVLLTPQVALAHATPVSSQPEPGAELGTAPGVVTIRFSEPLNRGLSSITVIDPNGRAFRGTPSDDRTIQAPLSTNAFGTYRVQWTTVSTVDGHTLRGSFTFGVGAAGVGQGETGGGDEPGAADLAIGVARAVEDLALLFCIGLLMVGALASRRPSYPWAIRDLRWVLGVLLAAGVAVVLGEALLAAQGSIGAVGSFLTTGTPGTARLLRVGLEATAVGLAFGRPRGRRAIGGVVAAAAGALAWSGHAAAASPQWAGVLVDWAHLLSAGVWAGSIVAIASIRPPEGWRSSEGRQLLDRFSPVGLAAFAVTVGLGAVRGWQELGTLSELIHSAYGRVLLIKVAAVAVMIPLSVLMWRRALRSPRVEARLVVVVVLATAVLGAFPFPPARVGEGAAAAASAPSALPGPGDLTLGGQAGQVVVGLTLRPGRPGPQDLLVYLMPLDGEAGAAELRAGLTVDGRPVPLRTCSATCRSARVSLSGGEDVEVKVEGRTGGTARFQIPELPAEDGAPLLDRMMTRMHELRSFRIHERLDSGLTVVDSRYTFVAPYEMTQRSRAPQIYSDIIWIDTTRYVRNGPNEPWKRQVGGRPTKVPAFVWDFFRPFQDAVVLGRQRVQGVPTTRVAFFGESPGVPVWFELWIDRTGLVHEAQMDTRGHFMHHVYSGFDGPIRIAPPSGA